MNYPAAWCLGTVRRDSSQRLLLLSNVATKLPYIDISVSIYLNVFSVASQQLVQDMVAIELCHSAPTAAAIRTPLQLLVVCWINPIYECSNSYLTGHDSK